MGDSKRRKETLGDQYGKESNILPWLPITKTQSEQFVKVSTTGAWIGIGVLAIGWATVRLIGPAFGWWKLVN